MNTQIPEYLLKIAEEYNIDVDRETEYLELNEAAAAHNIMLGEFDNKDFEIIAFFHELSHIIGVKKIEEILGIKGPKCQVSYLSKEGFCWEFAFILAKKYGYEWEFGSDVYKYAYNNLITYINSEYDDHYKKEGNKKMKRLITNKKLEDVKSDKVANAIYEYGKELFERQEVKNRFLKSIENDGFTLNEVKQEPEKIDEYIIDTLKECQDLYDHIHDTMLYDVEEDPLINDSTTKIYINNILNNWYRVSKGKQLSDLIKNLK